MINADTPQFHPNQQVNYKKILIWGNPQHTWMISQMQQNQEEVKVGTWWMVGDPHWFQGNESG